MAGRQRGTTTVEFAIVGLLLFTLLFGIIESGRAMFVLNSVQEAARRGARVAAVCPVNHPAIAQVALFALPGGGASSPVLQDFTAANVVVDYLNATGGPATSYDDIAFVRVRIVDYAYPLLFPFTRIEVPPFATTFPAESLGYVPELDLRTCFGT